MSHVKAAFEKVCKDAKQTEQWFVVLMERVPYYGGPEEGGWWGTDSAPAAYQQFPSKDQAEAAAEAARAMATELQTESRKRFGEQCLRETEWCEERGLDPDWLTEPAGETEYYVIVSREVPQPSYGCRHYE